mmetsp:Transcript_16381/g.36173  ORF Transcript_16381/g.36173 Transcript_16381/m.36173 type:complete len:209 (-) Transcript_16381:239-865(-)
MAVANVKVFSVSSMCLISGDTLAIISAREFPPRHSFSSMVRTEFRTWADMPAFNPCTTVPKVASALLIPMAWRCRKSSSPLLLAVTFLRFSDPAKSTSNSRPRRPAVAPGAQLSTVSMNRQWDREEEAFTEVSKVLARNCPCRRHFRTSSASSTSTVDNPSTKKSPTLSRTDSGVGCTSCLEKRPGDAPPLLLSPSKSKTSSFLPSLE